MDRKSRVKKSIVAVIALLLVVYIISSTYARYATSTLVNATTNVAKWAVQLKQGDTEISNNANLNFTVQSNANVVDGKIAPGVTATSTVRLYLTGTEVAVDFTATPGTAVGVPPDVSSNITIKDKNGNALSGSTIALPSGAAFTASDYYDVTITLTWTNNDEHNSADTALGIAGSTMTIPVTLNVTQHIGSGS